MAPYSKSDTLPPSLVELFDTLEEDAGAAASWTFAGDSAGGTLALGLANDLAKRGGKLNVSEVVLISALVDFEDTPDLPEAEKTVSLAANPDSSSTENHKSQISHRATGSLA